MMRSMRDDLMATLGSCMHRDALTARMHLDLGPVLAYPYVFPRILPGHRVAAGLPTYVGIPRHFAQLVVTVGIRRPSVHRLHAELIQVPPRQDLLARGSV